MKKNDELKTLKSRREIFHSSLQCLLGSSRTFLLMILMLPLGSILLVSCESDDEDDVPVNETPIAPSLTNGRPNDNLGCIEIDNRNVDIEVWDHGTIDGDIISLIVNSESDSEETILDTHELDGPGNSFRMSHSFAGNGYNYLTLFAHNEGDISPNTATISIDGNEFILSSNLETNGYVDIVVTGFGVDCSNSGGGFGDSGDDSSDGDGSSDDDDGDDPSNNKGKVTFWTGSNGGCGDIIVSVDGEGTESITGYYENGINDCGVSAGANFTLDPGTYSFTATPASCAGSWEGDFDITSNGCLMFELSW